MLLQYGDNSVLHELHGELLAKGTDLFLLRIAQRVPFIFIPGVGKEGTKAYVGAAALSKAFSVLLVEVDVSLPFTAIVNLIPDLCGGAGTAAGEVLSCDDSFLFQGCEGTTTLDELFHVVLYALFPELAVFVLPIVFQTKYVHPHNR